MKPDDIEFALENTKIILAPQRRIESFGNTVFHFHVISELMDSVNEVRVRDGKLHADRPSIVSPETYSKLLLDGFGEKARQYADQLEQHLGRMALLKYGFMVRKSDVVESVVHDPVEAVIDRVRERVTTSAEPMSAIIHGVDEGWEICLLKFTMGIVQESMGGNMDDFRRRGLL